MNHFNIINSYMNVLARFNNRLQEKAERGRLGIPVTIATTQGMEVNVILEQLYIPQNLANGLLH